MSGLTSRASAATATACTRNLSRQSAREGGGSRWACMITCTSLVAPGSTTPDDGRTQYFLGEVVLTWSGWGVGVGAGGVGARVCVRACVRVREKNRRG